MKRSLFLISLSLELAVFFPSLSFAQETRNLPDVWTVRAQSLTDDLMADAAALETFDRALLWARLGKIWWGYDREKARRWLQKAVEIVEFSSDQESPAQRVRRIAATRALLTIIAPLDKKISYQLTAILTTSNQATERDRGENAKALVDTALALVESDPTRAAELGSASLRTGRTAQIIFLFYKLRAKDGSLADKLFNEALAIAQTSFDSELMSHLASVAFPQSLDPYLKTPIPPDSLRVRLLSILADDLQVRPVLGSDENIACGFAPIAAPLLEQFDRFMPQQAATVRLSIVICKTKSDSFDQKTEDSSSDQPRKSVDDLLQGAKNAPNFSVRVWGLVRAARMASEQKDFDRAIAILESMTTEERDQFKEPWKGWRWEFAASSAYAHYKREEYGLIRKVIDETPLDLRPFAQIFFANKVATEHDRTFAIEYFDAANRELAKADIANPAKAGMYLEIMRQYVTIQPGEALNVLKEAVTELNRIKSSPLQSGAPGNSAASESGEMWRPINLPSTLLEIDDFGTRQIILSIKAPLMRVEMRLGLLTSVMERRPTGRSPKTKVAVLMGC